MIGDGHLQWEWRNLVGSPSGFDARDRIKNELLDGWYHNEDKESGGWSRWGGGEQKFCFSGDFR